MVFRRKSIRRRNVRESHNESIPRQPPRPVIELADIRHTARGQIRVCGVWEGRGAEIAYCYQYNLIIIK